VEDTGSGKLGTLKVVYFIFVALFFKLTGKKIVWTHHNIHSHSGPNFYNKFLSVFLMKNADLIVIHTLESKRYISETYWHKLRYFFHPITDYSRDDVVRNTAPRYDILMWGAIRRSKGVENFLKYLKEKTLLTQYSIHIIGKISDSKLKRELLQYADNENIIIEDRFIETSELHKLHIEAKYIFFSYTGGSNLNSGVVVRSLPLGRTIICPDKGGFKDLYHNGLVETYTTYDDVLTIIKSGKTIESSKIGKFCQEHTWEKFGEFLNSELRNTKL
jgi:hypothetical protein